MWLSRLVGFRIPLLLGYVRYVFSSPPTRTTVSQEAQLRLNEDGEQVQVEDCQNQLGEECKMRMSGGLC